MREALGVDLLFNSIPADAISTIVHRDKSYAYGSRMCESWRNRPGRVEVPGNVFIDALELDDWSTTDPSGVA
jgi:hypothetical protein